MVSPDRSVHNTVVGGLAGNDAQPDAGKEAVVLFPVSTGPRVKQIALPRVRVGSANQLEAWPLERAGSAGEAGAGSAGAGRGLQPVTFALDLQHLLCSRPAAW